MVHGFICGMLKSVLDSYSRSWQPDTASPEELVCHLGLWGATGDWTDTFLELGERILQCIHCCEICYVSWSGKIDLQHP